MSTQPKAAASAANAKHSSGPRTDEGKARSSRNAVTHGLSAKHLVIAPGRQEEFDELHQALRDEIAPQGALEQIAFDQLLHAAWNQQRFRALESEMITGGLDPILDDSLAQRLDRLYRYAAAADRAYSRALKELRSLQTERGLRITLDPASTEAVPVLASIPVLSKQVHRNRAQVARQFVDELDAFVNAPMPAPIERKLYPPQPDRAVA